MKSLYIQSLVFLMCSVFTSHYNVASAQNKAWDQWDRELVEKANTAQHVDYLSEEEKKVILFMNLARLDGQRFASTFLDAFMDESATEKTGYVRSLYRDLKGVSDLPLLLPEEDLASIAREHATKSGQSGHVGHKDFKKRFEPFMGNPYTHVGENCSYGYTRAIDIVITLLIDEGVSNLGHRKNILNAHFNSVGVSIKPHKTYRVNCVIDYGQQVRSTLNDVPME
jgi:uncharacterized protein YkwD